MSILIGPMISNSRPNNVTLDDNANLRELEQLVDKLQTVNRTLTSMYSHSWRRSQDSRMSLIELNWPCLFIAIDASLTNSTSDGNLIWTDFRPPRWTWRSPHLTLLRGSWDENNMVTSTATVLIELASILFIGLFLSSVSLLFLLSKSTARSSNNVFPVFVCVCVRV